MGFDVGIDCPIGCVKKNKITRAGDFIFMIFLVRLCFSHF